MFRYGKIVVAAALLWMANIASALNNVDVVNISSMQRMLSQRLAKTYLMQVQVLNNPESRSQQQQAIALFDNNLINLKAALKERKAQELLLSINDSWEKQKVLLKAKAEMSKSVAVLEYSQQLLALHEKLVGLALDNLNKTHVVNIDGRSIAVMDCPLSCIATARLLDLSGKQQMLSQRIATLYLTKSMGLNYPKVDQLFATSLTEYEATLTTMMDDSENSDEVNTALKRVKTMWDFSKQGLGLSSNDLFVPALICSTTEKLLVRMQGVSKLYEQRIQQLATKDSVVYN